MLGKVLLAIFLLITVPAQAEETRSSQIAIPQELARAIVDYDNAQIRGDRGALERLLADDYVLVNSHAQIENKAALIHDYTAPGSTLMPYVVEEKIVKIWADGAVLAGAVTLQGTSDGAPFKGRIRFADVWQKRGMKWQVIFTEVTPIPKV
jgi:ketosteroid isomerase-like protein